MTETVEQRCARIFREIVGLQNPGLLSGWEDSRVLTEPLEAIDIDSLSRLEENAYGIELDEADVNACRTIGELAKLVTAAAK